MDGIFSLADNGWISLKHSLSRDIPHISILALNATIWETPHHFESLHSYQELERSTFKVINQRFMMYK